MINGTSVFDHQISVVDHQKDYDLHQTSVVDHQIFFFINFFFIQILKKFNKMAIKW